MNEQQKSTICEMKEESLCFVLDHESKIIENHVAFENGLSFQDVNVQRKYVGTT